MFMFAAIAFGACSDNTSRGAAGTPSPDPSVKGGSAAGGAAPGAAGGTGVAPNLTGGSGMGTVSNGGAPHAGAEAGGAGPSGAGGASTAGAGGTGPAGAGGGGKAPVGGYTGTPAQTPATAPLDSTAPSKMIGFATSEKCGPQGTTGGGNGPPSAVVRTTAELQAALQAEGPAVIEVQGEMQGVRLKDGSSAKDKTLIGSNGAFISGGFRVDGGHNIIVKNIKFGEAKVVNGDDNLADGFTVHNTTCVWIDHCEFTNSIDGNLDIVGGDGAMSSWITVSWSKFWYDAEYAKTVNPNHRLSNLIVGNDDRPDPLPYVTYHHNWWAENVAERMPRGRWGWVHLFNNYYSTQGNNYGIGASVGIQYVVEHNFFEPGFEDPVNVFNRDQGVAIRLSGNELDGVSWVDTKPQDAVFGSAFDPAKFYPYTLQTPAEAKASVMAGAGVKN